MLPSLGKRAILAKRLGPSASEPIEAKPSFFGPTKRQPPKSQPGRAAKRPLASGCPPPRTWARGLLGAPAAAAVAREGPLDWAQARPLGRPQQGPWPGFRFPATQPTDRGTRPGKRRRRPNLTVSLGKAAKQQQKPHRTHGSQPAWPSQDGEPQRKDPLAQATRPLGPAGRPTRLGSLSSGGCWSGCKG